MDSYDYRRVLLRTPGFVFNSFKLCHSLGLTQIQTMKDRWPRCRANSGGGAQPLRRRFALSPHRVNFARESRKRPASHKRTSNPEKQLLLYPNVRRKLIFQCPQLILDGWSYSATATTLRVSSTRKLHESRGRVVTTYPNQKVRGTRMFRSSVHFAEGIYHASSSVAQ